MVVRNPNVLSMPITLNEFEVDFHSMYTYDMGLVVASAWLGVLVWSMMKAVRSALRRDVGSRWTSTLLLLVGAALLPILVSNGRFHPLVAQPWLLAVAMMTHPVTLRRRRRVAPRGDAQQTTGSREGS